jgi:hypothetical protein
VRPTHQTWPPDEWNRGCKSPQMVSGAQVPSSPSLPLSVSASERAVGLAGLPLTWLPAPPKVGMVVFPRHSFVAVAGA